MTYYGGCLCGALRYRVDGEPSNRCYCHCTSCRRATGAPFVAWATFARGAFHLAQGALATVRSSDKVSRGFCAACGTSLTYAHDERPAEIDLALATLDEPGAVAPEYHIWVWDKLPWVTIGDGLPQYRGWKKDG